MQAENAHLLGHTQANWHFSLASELAWERRSQIQYAALMRVTSFHACFYAKSFTVAPALCL